MTFDPARWAQSVFIHPTRLELEEGHMRAQLKLNLKKKLQKWVPICNFAPDRHYHATVVIRGVRREEQAGSILTAMRVLLDAPLGFDVAISHTIHVVLGQGRPLIGLIAAEEPLDRDSAVAHFPVSGD